jgi:hypothetical protein
VVVHGHVGLFGGAKIDPHCLLARQVRVANWNTHAETSVMLVRKSEGRLCLLQRGSRWTFDNNMYNAVKQFGMQFCISWHWNAAAGDPRHALDCCEEDYAWGTVMPDGRFFRTVHFEQLAEWARRRPHLRILARLAQEKHGGAAARR